MITKQFEHKETESIKISKTVLELVRKNKMVTGIPIRVFIENATNKALNEVAPPAKKHINKLKK